MDYLLHHLLESAARRTPSGKAVVDLGRSISYAELDGAANRVANTLVQLGVQPGDRVGLYLDKSLESVLGIYGVLKAGAAYVPLDPEAPTARLSYIARNCGIRVLLTGQDKQSQWKDLVRPTSDIESLVVLDAMEMEPWGVPEGIRAHTRAALEKQSSVAPTLPTIGLDLAYILYTSGSTGDPKGVKLSHRNALAFVNWAVETFSVTSQDVLSSHAPLHFDLSVFDLFAAAEAGATVVLVPPKTSIFPIQVARFIEENSITVWYSVPSILSMLVLRGGLSRGALPCLRTVLFAGEVFPTKYLRDLMALLPHVRFANLYGPTETNVCTWYDVSLPSEEETEPVPIGRAIDGVEVFPVTETGAVAEPGEVGELFVRGPTVMQGYWGDPERTARSLFPNPFNDEVNDPVYRTGDLVQLNAEGNYRFLGRRDSQIKSRGYRIERGDIEAALYSHPQVEECAVVAIPDDVVTNKIRAYIVARDGIDANVLVQFCADRIPRYMIPEQFEFRDALPKTSTGKTDRRSLARESMAHQAEGGDEQ